MKIVKSKMRKPGKTPKHPEQAPKIVVPLVAVTLASLIIMTILESLETLIFPKVTGEQSSIVSIVLATLIVTTVAYFILRRRQSMIRQLAGENTERQKAEERLKNALEETQQHNAEVSALLRAAQAVIIHGDFQGAARAIFDICKEVTKATAGYVALLSRDGTENEVLFLDSGDLPCVVDPSLPMPIRGLRAEAYRTGKAVYDNNFSQSQWMEFMPEGHVSLNNVMFSPLIIQDKVVGLIGLANKPGGFTEDAARLVTAMGKLASIGLVNSRTLEELEYREKRFRSIAESTPDGMVTIDAHGNVVLWNRAAEKIFGYTVEEMIGKPLNIIMPERFHETHKSRLNRVASGGKPRIIGKTVEVIGLKKNKSEFPLELSMAKWKTGEGVFFTAVIRDISERKLAEETLQQSQERYQNLVENINDIIFEVDTEGNIIYISPAIERIGKYKADELIGQNFSRFVHPDDMPGLISSFNHVLAGILKPFEFRVLDKDGSIRYARTNSRQRMQHGQVIGITGVLSDVTEQKKMLDSLTITDRLAALGNMAGGLAHELNNPLTGVIGYAQLLLDRKDLSKDVRRDLTGIYEEAQRASEVIKTFMTFALKRPSQKQLCDINSLIEDVLKLRQHDQRKTNIRVKTNFDPELPLVMVGPIRMRQVFLDIITNAEYFMFEAHKKGTLTITTEKEGDIIRASFADDGPGIPPQNLRQIFNPFFTTTEVGQGIGLSLSVCHRIVTEHGGNIHVESEPGKGATFMVELPISKE